MIDIKNKVIEYNLFSEMWHVNFPWFRDHFDTEVREAVRLEMSAIIQSYWPDRIEL